MSFGSWALDLLFPPRCAGCGRVDTPWCDRCQARLLRVPLDTIPRPAPPPLQGIITTGRHTGQLQRLVHALKYDNARVIAQPLGARLAARLEQQHWQIDVVAAVPLHVHRLQERGYNQAKLVSQQVAELLGKPDVSNAIHRDHDTRSQVGLNRAQRQQNVADAFRAEPVVAGQHILLIDDVFTTGATLQACAQALVDSGAAAVFGLTITAAR